VLNYRFHLDFLESGTYSIGPFELAFQSRLGGAEQFTRLGATDIEVAQPFYLRWQLLGMATLGTLVLGAGLLRFLGRASFRRQSAAKVTAGETGLMERAATLGRLRVSGDAMGYAATLIELSSAIRNMTGQPVDDHAAKLDQVKFGGLVMSDGELKVLEREIEDWAQQRSSDR